MRPSSDDDVETIVEAAWDRLPGLAAIACRLQAACEAEWEQGEGAARWSERLAAIESRTGPAAAGL